MYSEPPNCVTVYTGIKTDTTKGNIMWLKISFYRVGF